MRLVASAIYELQNNGCTLEVITQELGVTREYVRQIEAKALLKCRK